MSGELSCRAGMKRALDALPNQDFSHVCYLVKNECRLLAGPKSCKYEQAQYTQI
jgi:hypothetical protein